MSESKALERRVLAPELDAFARVGQWLAASETENPDELQRGATAALRLYFARELGLSPLAASELSVIRGRLVVSAKLLRARAAQYGYRVTKIAGDEQGATAALVDRDTGEELGRYTFTMDDARKAGLVREKSAWKTHPARMLWARASKFVIDDFAPEVSMGLVLEDEAAEITGEVTNESWEDTEPTATDDDLPSPAPPVGAHSDRQTEYVPEPEGDFVAPKGERGAGGTE